MKELIEDILVVEIVLVRYGTGDRVRIRGAKESTEKAEEIARLIESGRVVGYEHPLVEIGK